MRISAICVLLSMPLMAQVTNQSKPTTGVVPDRVYASANRPHALALIGDIYDGPILMRDGLIAALVRENIPVTFIEDPAQLNAKSLSECCLLIIARNGRYWPEGYGKPQTAWMTDVQQKAIWDFVNNGGGFLGVHNAHTMYPPGGLYYKLFGGDFGGHPKPYWMVKRLRRVSGRQITHTALADFVSPLGGSLFVVRSNRAEQKVLLIEIVFGHVLLVEYLVVFHPGCDRMIIVLYANGERDPAASSQCHGVAFTRGL